jgi:hypothetical protein
MNFIGFGQIKGSNRTSKGLLHSVPSKQNSSTQISSALLTLRREIHSNVQHSQADDSLHAAGNGMSE